MNLTPFIWFLDVYIHRNLTLHVNKKSQPGINSQTQAKSLFKTMTGQDVLLHKRKKLPTTKSGNYTCSITLVQLTPIALHIRLHLTEEGIEIPDFQLAHFLVERHSRPI